MVQIKICISNKHINLHATICFQMNKAVSDFNFGLKIGSQHSSDIIPVVLKGHKQDCADLIAVLNNGTLSGL